MHTAKNSRLLRQCLVLLTVAMALASCGGSSDSADSSASASSASSSVPSAHPNDSETEGSSRSAASASGSMIPSDTLLVDSAGNSWTVADGVVLQNRTTTPSQKVILLLYYNGTIFQENIHCDWWSWASGAWLKTTQPAGAEVPACSTLASSALSSNFGAPVASAVASGGSASGSMIPSATKLMDSAGNTWTVSGGIVSQNGTAIPSADVVLLLYFNGVIYQENNNCDWWRWSAGAWLATAQPAAAGVPACGSGVSSVSSGTSSSSSSGSSSSGSSSSASSVSASAASASGSMIPAATMLVDSAGNSWTVRGGIVSQNGTAIPSADVVLLLYFNGVIYQENGNCDWWSWGAGAWLATAQPAASGIPTCSSGVTSVSSGSSSSGGSGPIVTAAAGSVPAAAAAVGYNTLTADSTTISPTQGNWYTWNFQGSTAPASNYTQNDDGTINLQGNTEGIASLTSARATHKSHGFTGTGYGGGMYWEVTATMSNPEQPPYGVPAALWLVDLEHTSQGPPYTQSWPVTTSTFWPSVPQLQNIDGSSGMDDFIEIDMMEYDFTVSQGYPAGYEINMSNWTNHVHGDPVNWGPSNKWPQVDGGSSGSTPVPVGTDFSKPHKYAMLWVPATGSGQTTYTQGYLKFYFDGVQIAGGLADSPVNPYDGKARPCYWNYHDPADVVHYPTPTQAGAPTTQNQGYSGGGSWPTYFDVNMSILDFRHLMPIMNSGAFQGMTIYSSQVWQASADNNITQ